LIEVLAEEATLVVHTSADETSVFAENGEVRIAHLKRPGATGEESRLKPSQFYTCRIGQRGVVAARPAHAFVTGMPRSFMDTLPPRIARFKERSVAPRRSGEFSYEDVEDWINSVPTVRRAVLHRWQAKAAEPAFRRALLADLKDHPEWDRVLNPEKYKDTSDSPGAASK
jgi:hypothetical protein